jgi:hypothetical protein
MTVPATSFSVVVARHGYTTVALGPYRSRDFAGLAAFELGIHLRPEADSRVEVEDYDETVTHLPSLPTDPKELAAHVAEEPAGDADHLPVYARLVAQVGRTRVKGILAEAHTVLADELFAA